MSMPLKFKGKALYSMEIKIIEIFFNKITHFAAVVKECLEYTVVSRCSQLRQTVKKQQLKEMTLEIYFHFSTTVPYL